MGRDYIPTQNSDNLLKIVEYIYILDKNKNSIKLNKFNIIYIFIYNILYKL
jgi:hypothetical protein